MKIKKYLGNDMREAMGKVRTELGDDAVIISSRRVGGRTEITAANDYNPEKIKEIMEQKKNGQEESRPAKKTRDKVINNNSLNVIENELARLRKLFEGEISQLAWREMQNAEPNRFALLTRFEMAGVSRDIAEKIVDKVLPCRDVEVGWAKASKLFGGVIKTTEEDILEKGGVIALLGSTGVGKTTTAAKLAAQYALKHGRNQVALVSTDNYRIGGQEQLVSFGSILGVPVQFANNREELKRILDSLSERKLVIIDTAGMSQRDMGLADQLDNLQISNVDIKPYLILSATAQESIVRETIRSFSRINLAGAVLTKVDECPDVGPVISSLLRNKLPLAFIGNGQRVPEDLQKADSKVIFQKVMENYDKAQKESLQQQLEAQKEQIKVA